MFDGNTNVELKREIHCLNDSEFGFPEIFGLLFHRLEKVTPSRRAHTVEDPNRIQGLWCTEKN